MTAKDIKYLEIHNAVDGKKKIVAMPGHDKLEVPMVDKRKAQVILTCAFLLTKMEF